MAGQSSKQCKDCGETKSGTEFHRDKRRADGLAFYCKPCVGIRAKRQYDKNPAPARARAIQRRIDNPERKRAESLKWRTENKERQAELSARWYENNREYARSLQRSWYEANKEKAHADAKRWAEANRELRREIRRRWKQANPDMVRLHAENRRARIKGSATVPFAAAQLAERWAYYGNKCWICHSEATATDHVKPISKGGAHMLCNLRPICKPCNSSKGAKWPYPKELHTYIRLLNRRRAA